MSSLQYQVSHVDVDAIGCGSEGNLVECTRSPAEETEGSGCIDAERIYYSRSRYLIPLYRFVAMNLHICVVESSVAVDLANAGDDTSPSQLTTNRIHCRARASILVVVVISLHSSDK